MEQNRLSIMHHMSPTELIAQKEFMNLHRDILYKNLKAFGEQKDMYGRTQKGGVKTNVGG